MTAGRVVWWLLASLLVVAACAPVVPSGRDTPFRAGSLPDLAGYGSALPAGTTAYSNDSLADLFVALTHDLEWGAQRPNLVRFEVPVSVGLSGAGSAQYVGFLDRYLAALRSRSGIDIARRPGRQNLLIRFVPGNAFRTSLPRQSCVVAPGRPAWEVFRENSERLGTRSYERRRSVGAMTVFIPDNAEPYLVRICLVEEIAQALGPVNDLYGLGPSIFNDDGAHIWPTKLDFLMLRVLYQPQMRTGLNRRATRMRAREILDRLNPEGRGARPLPPIRQRQMAKWAETLREAFSRGAGQETRQAAARRAVRIASGKMPGSAYHCRSLTALARLQTRTPQQALATLDRARSVCTRAHGLGDIRLARIALARARAIFGLKRPERALAELRGLPQILGAHAQEERLIALYALQAASLRAIQQAAPAAAAQSRALAWGAYALGRDHPDVRGRSSGQ